MKSTCRRLQSKVNSSNICGNLIHVQYQNAFEIYVNCEMYQNIISTQSGREGPFSVFYSISVISVKSGTSNFVFHGVISAINFRGNLPESNRFQQEMMKIKGCHLMLSNRIIIIKSGY